MSTTVDRQSATAHATSHSAASACVGRWQLTRLVASGPICDVYQARPADAGHALPARYALKLLRAEWHTRPEAVAQIQREAFLGRMVSHRHLLPVLAAETEGPAYFIVTPWLDGITLEQYLIDYGAVPLATALWIVRQGAEALFALHQQGWIHGDIKPANLLIAPGWHATLIDLGFARQPSEAGSAADRFGLGTPNYLAPEAITSQLANDVRGDIYSLGALLFHLLSGRPPFLGESLESIVAAHRCQPAPPLRSLCPTVPREVAELVHATLAKEPLRRPQTPAELIARLVRLEIDALAERF